MARLANAAQHTSITNTAEQAKVTQRHNLLPGMCSNHPSESRVQSSVKHNPKTQPISGQDTCPGSIPAPGDDAMHCCELTGRCLRTEYNVARRSVLLVLGGDRSIPSKQTKAVPGCTVQQDCAQPQELGRKPRLPDTFSSFHPISPHVSGPHLSIWFLLQGTAPAPAADAVPVPATQQLHYSQHFCNCYLGA